MVRIRKLEFGVSCLVDLSIFRPPSVRLLSVLLSFRPPSVRLPSVLLPSFFHPSSIFCPSSVICPSSVRPSVFCPSSRQRTSESDKQKKRQRADEKRMVAENISSKPPMDVRRDRQKNRQRADGIQTGKSQKRDRQKREDKKD